MFLLNFCILIVYHFVGHSFCGSGLQTFFMMALLFIGTKENSVELLKNESAKTLGLHGNVGYVCVHGFTGPWVHELCGSNFYLGCVGQIFLHGSNFLGGG